MQCAVSVLLLDQRGDDVHCRRPITVQGIGGAVTNGRAVQGILVMGESIGCMLKREWLT